MPGVPARMSGSVVTSLHLLTTQPESGAQHTPAVSQTYLSLTFDSPVLVRRLQLLLHHRERIQRCVGLGHCLPLPGLADQHAQSDSHKGALPTQVLLAAGLLPDPNQR